MIFVAVPGFVVVVVLVVCGDDGGVGGFLRRWRGLCWLLRIFGGGTTLTSY